MNESLPSSYSRRCRTLVQFWATLVAMLWWGGIGVAHAGTASLLVASGFSDSVPRYDAITGASLGDFVPAGSGGLDQPRGLAIGPDGNLYVAADGTADAVLRYDGGTGAFIDPFVTGLDPFGIVFGPDGHLYAADFTTAEVLRYDGTTGGLIDTFVSDPSRLGLPRDLLFGPDGNLYVSSAAFRQVVRYNGTTGAFIDVFASRVDARGLVFGPDGNLYVASFVDDAVLRFNGTTGVFIDTFVTVGSGGLDAPRLMLFTNGPPGIPGFIEGELRAQATSIDALSLNVIDAPNSNAAKGRRNAMSNKVNAAANAVAAGNIADAIDQLTSLLAKLDGEPKPKDWMVDSLEKDALRADIEGLITLLGFLL